MLSAFHPKYAEMQEAIKKTWADPKKLPENITVKYIYGAIQNNQNNVLFDDYNIYFPVQEAGINITLKTFYAFKYAYANFEFDYLYRCCNGCYVNLEKLNEWIQNKPLTNVYSGEVNTHLDIPYCSGAGMLFSKDVIYELINFQNINFKRVDDYEIGSLLKSIDIVPDYNATSYHIDGEFHLNDTNHYHYHFRNHPDFMYKIHEILTKD